MNDRHNPLVTIAIPTFNRANGFLKEALQSAASQSYPNIEIIVADNCSTDHTGALVMDFDDPRVKYIRHERNIGANNNFNFCVNKARGTYFLLLHDDDLIDEDFVESAMRALNRNYEVGAVFTGSRLIDEKGQVIHEAPNICAGLSTKGFFEFWFEGKFSLYLCSTLFHTEKLKKIGGFQSKTHLFQDVVAEAILAWEYGRVDVRDIKASFRRHSDNRGGNPQTVAAWCEDCLYLLDIICKYAGNAEELRKKGIRYFANKNYKLAEKVPSLLERWKTYKMISRRYDHSYTPFHYLYALKVKPVETRLKQSIKRLMS